MASSLIVAASIISLAQVESVQGNASGNGSNAQTGFFNTTQNEDNNSKGIFNVHYVDGRFYLEIPEELLGMDMLWYAEMDDVPIGVGKMGYEIDRRIIRFDRLGNHVIVMDFTAPLEKRAGLNRSSASDQDDDEENAVDPLRMAAEKASMPTVLLDLPVINATDGNNNSLQLVDMTDVLSVDIPEFSPISKLKEGGYDIKDVDPKRSFILKVVAFPSNLEIRSLLTFDVEDPESSGVSIVVRHSITLLPDTPMMGRYSDPRIGYLSTNFEDFSGMSSSGVATKNFIERFHLEKKDPDARISEPVKPITFYISREVPSIWRSYIKKGIESWQTAFEAAGFKNAIVALDAPDEEDDPNWDPADTRYSVIRWEAQDTENAMGPSIVDPRSGEILSAHVELYANILKTAETWYFLQASPSDIRARSLPLQDDVLGEYLSYIVTHEVGHALGLRHNFRASQAFTVDQLRDPEFAYKYGPVASIMSYGRCNYVAQPEDNVKGLIPKVGPYDIFAICWGYQSIPDAQSPADEAPVLDSWAAEQINNSWLQFGGEDDAALTDPTVLTENIGSDRINATALGLANLERVMTYIVPATTQKKGGDFKRLNEIYSNLLSFRETWLSSVIKEIGGVPENRTLAGRGGAQFIRVSKYRQRQDVSFVLDNLRTPKAFMSPEVIGLVAPTGKASRILISQNTLLDQLLSADKLLILSEGEILEPESAYRISEFLGDVQDGIWEELVMDEPVIDPLRRDLQLHYLARIKANMADDNLCSAIGFRAVARYELNRLGGQIVEATPRVKDKDTLRHLDDCKNQIIKML